MTISNVSNSGNVIAGSSSTATLNAGSSANNLSVKFTYRRVRIKD